MKKACILGVLLAALIPFSLAAGTAAETVTKQKILADLDTIQHIFEIKYAPTLWKKEFANWKLETAIEEAKNKIKSHPAPTLKECQVILRDFFNTTRDYHVGVTFFSTESASLPFMVKGSEGRYFFCFVDWEEITDLAFPFEEGDEILEFGDRPIQDVIEELRIQEFGTNTLETDQALAEMALTSRKGSSGQLVPSGTITVTGRKKGESGIQRATLNWDYYPEKIRDFAKLPKMHMMAKKEGNQEEGSDLQALLKNSGFFEKFMIPCIWDPALAKNALSANHHSLGARRSFIPKLGQKLWSSHSGSIFDAYIFESPSNKRIGYIRLPHYMGGEEEVYEFGHVMNFFQQTTDALVIDQINNPGGSLFYFYALASTLTDKPLYVPEQHLALTQEEVYTAHTILTHLSSVTDTLSARYILGETMEGYPVDYQFAMTMKKFCQFVIGQWEENKLYTDASFLFGFDEIKPHPQFRYTKPILMLINSLDFSGGDFIPAILQDNQRATIMGTRTAGAGGYVLKTSFPNHSGIQKFLMTGSLAERLDKRPLENLGVRPDIYYAPTVADLQGNYKDYVKAIVEAIDSLTPQQYNRPQ